MLSDGLDGRKASKTGVSGRKRGSAVKPGLMGANSKKSSCVSL